MGRSAAYAELFISTITYGVIGYSDAAMVERWRLVSAIEGIDGIILAKQQGNFFGLFVGIER